MTTFETQLKEKLGEHNQNEVNIKIIKLYRQKN